VGDDPVAAPPPDGGGKDALGRSDLGDLTEGQLDRGLPAEDGNENLELLLLGKDLGDRAGMVSKGPSMTVTDSPIS